MSVIRKLAGQTAIYGIPSILGRTLNFLLAYLHLDVFPPESYGVTVELYAYLSFVMLFLLYGMETAFFRFAQTEPQTKVFNTLQTGLYGSTIIFLVGSLWSHKDLASGLGYASQANYFVWLILIIAFDVLAAVPLARLRFLQKPFTFVFINVTGIFTNIGINVFVLVYWFPQYFSGNTDFFLSSWFNPEIGVGYIFIANLIASGVKYGLTLFWGLPNPINFSWNLWKKALNYAWPLIFTGFAGLINEVADRILLGRILTPKLGVEAARYQIGVYGGCYKLAIIINICVQAFRYAAEPFFFQQLKDRSDRNMVL
ncbi:MAG: lipopolysaccharide biosynthesis protein [Luteibaculum sp.]